MEDARLKEIIRYFQNDLQLNDDDYVDISYNKWIIKNKDLQYLCEPFYVSNLDDKATNEYKPISDEFQFETFAPNDLIEKFDHNCELKLLNWLIDDDEHKEKFLKAPGIKLDRHSDISPYKFNYIPISNDEPPNTINNYINASFIHGPFKNEDYNLFIATQGPLNQTVSAFWKMILYHKIHLIIMLANLNEIGITKSAEYWPTKVNKVKDIDKSISIELISEEDYYESYALIRKFKINKTFEIVQIHVTSWPDHEYPDNNKVIDKLIETCDENRKMYSDSPIVVHCSAGVGRTGTFIAIYNIIKCLKVEKEMGVLPLFNVFNVVRKLREMRFMLVRSELQYKYIYNYCYEWIINNYFN